MKLFQLYRYPKPSPGPDVETIDGLPNLFNATRWPAWPGLVGAPRVQLDHGIDSVSRVDAVDGRRRPAILIASKPHQAGSDWTPWHDELNPEVGHVRYYGDNKATLGGGVKDPPGNRSIAAEFELQRSGLRSDRSRAAPLLFFESLVHEGRAKGFWRFIGFGLVQRAQLTTQIDRQERWFVNYVFDCALFDLSSEGLELPWAWIAARRDPTKSLDDCLRLAPAAWQTWVDQGERAVEIVRQRVTRFQLLDRTSQRPDSGTPAERALGEVVAHYKRIGPYSGVGEHRFEGLASEVVGSYLRESGQYRPGWITRRAADGGIDFVSRLDLGVGAGSLRLVVLGQAKCVSPESPPTSGLD
ncbi:MAG TPA: hypothetical protein VJ506_02340, partial [Candidatus Limnocylindrales bacterium]|nr:hypothetical protein [Candidatus Limnocylindrales bacterium]